MSRYQISFLMATALFLAGCQTLNKPANKSAVIIKASQEAPIQGAVQEKKYELNLAVVPFAEKRGNLKSYGSVYRYLIPLVPYGTMSYERPDQARMFNTQNEFEFNMNENLVKIIIDSARKSGLFKYNPYPYSIRIKGGFNSKRGNLFHSLRGKDLFLWHFVFRPGALVFWFTGRLIA